MSADVLRSAAALLRERAEAATPVEVESGAWSAYALGSEGYAVLGRPREGRIARTFVARCGMNDWDTDRHNAEYIATMHPAVGLTLADLLCEMADHADAEPADGTCNAAALTVARTILGGTQ